jgi:hypothetical protein
MTEIGQADPLPKQKRVRIRRRDDSDAKYFILECSGRE